MVASVVVEVVEVVVAGWVVVVAASVVVVVVSAMSGETNRLIALAKAVSNVQIATVPSPTSFGEDEAGELYVCCFDSKIRKLQPDATNHEITAMPATSWSMTRLRSTWSSSPP